MLKWCLKLRPVLIQRQCRSEKSIFLPDLLRACENYTLDHPPPSPVQGVSVSGTAFYDTGSAPFLANETVGTFADVPDFTTVGVTLGAGQPYNGPVAAQVSLVTAGSGAPVTLPFAFTSLVFPSTPLRSVSWMCPVAARVEERWRPDCSGRLFVRARSRRVCRHCSFWRDDPSHCNCESEPPLVCDGVAVIVGLAQ